MIVAGLSAEFRLVAACCRPRTRPDFVQVIAAVSGNGFDPDLLLATARAHRVEGFVEDGLRAGGVMLPASSHALLAARAKAARLQMLRNAGEEVRIDRLFRDGGVEPVFIKGATLAMLAHGTLALKTSWDVDVLVPPTGMGTAQQILSDAGYRLDLPGIEHPFLVRRFLERNKETCWVNADRQTTIELHSALVDDVAQLPTVGSGSPTQMVQITRNSAIATFACPELFAYLCVHGTVHRWERLKWLTDIAAMLESGPETITTLHSAAPRLAVRRSMGTALILCADILGTVLPANLQTELERDRATQLLIRLSADAINKPDAVVPHSLAGLRQALTRLRAQRLLVSGLRQHLSVIRGQLSRAYTTDRLLLPVWMLPIHAVVWIPLRLLTRPWRKHQVVGGNTASKP